MGRPADIDLGRALIARGLITPDQARDALAATAPGRTILDVLVGRGQLSPDHARAALALSGSGRYAIQPPPQPLVIPGPAPTRTDSGDELVQSLGESGTSLLKPSGRHGGGPLALGPLSIGDEVDGYKIERLLGKGGMGAVYLARPKDGSPQVALKVLLSEDAEARTRFQHEVEAMARVDRHPGVVRIKKAGKLGSRGYAYAIIDYVDGQSLSGAISRGCEPERAARYLEKVARAIHHCHQAGILHRDLKPANILIRAEDDEALVTDFGIALAKDREKLTMTGAIVGTPVYMSPEQLSSGHHVDARADVYGLGAILYEALAGAPPFPVGAPITDLMVRIGTEVPPAPSTFAPKVPPELDRICSKALEKNPADRYQTAAELADDLGRFLRRERVTARHVGSLERGRRTIALHRRAVGTGAVVAVVSAAVVLGVVVVGLRERARSTAAAAHKEALARLETAVEKAGLPIHPEQRATEDVKAASKAVAAAAARLAELELPVPESAVTTWASLLEDPALAAPPPSGEKGSIAQLVAAAAAVRDALAGKPGAGARAKPLVPSGDPLEAFLALADERADRAFVEKLVDPARSLGPRYARGGELARPRAVAALASRASTAPDVEDWRVLERLAATPNAAAMIDGFLAAGERAFGWMRDIPWERAYTPAMSSAAALAAIRDPRAPAVRERIVRTIQRRLEALSTESDRTRDASQLQRHTNHARQCYAVLRRLDPETKAPQALIDRWYSRVAQGYGEFIFAGRDPRKMRDIAQTAVRSTALLYDFGLVPEASELFALAGFVELRGAYDNEAEGPFGTLLEAQIAAATAPGFGYMGRGVDRKLAAEAWRLLDAAEQKLAAKDPFLARTCQLAAAASRLKLLSVGLSPDGEPTTVAHLPLIEDLHAKLSSLARIRVGARADKANALFSIVERSRLTSSAAETAALSKKAIDEVLALERETLDLVAAEAKDKPLEALNVASGVRPKDAANTLAGALALGAKISGFSNDHEGALAFFDRALTHAVNPLILIQKADCLLILGRPEDARETLKKVPAGALDIEGLAIQIKALEARIDKVSPR